MKKIISFVTTLLVFLSSSVYSQAQKAEQDIALMMKQLDVVGLSVAVVKHNKLIYSNAFGLKDIENNTPLSTSDIFRIASISKSFSSTAIMQLVEAGKFTLDDDFGKLVGFRIRNPKYPESVITLKMVLSHTSSINDSQDYFNLDVINPDKNPEYAKCYNNYAPGTDYEYCNLNFNMVGAVIEKWSGERFDSYIKQHILDPLNLYGGYCVDALDASRFATIYDYDAATKKHITSPNAYHPRREEIKSYVMGYTTPVFSPTGGMKISAIDLAGYMSMHMNYGKANGVRIISKKHSKLMQAKVQEKDGYGLALRVVNDLIPGRTLVGHTGSAYGLYSAMFFDPKEKFGIVVITNGCSPAETGGFNTVIRSAVNILYNELVR